MCKGRKNADCPPYVGTLTRGVICLCLYTRTAPHPTLPTCAVLSISMQPEGFCGTRPHCQTSTGPATYIWQFTFDGLKAFKLFITSKVLTSCKWLVENLMNGRDEVLYNVSSLSPGGANSLPAVCLEQETMWRNTPLSHLNPPKPMYPSPTLFQESPLPLVRNSLEISQQRAGRLSPFFLTDFRQLSSLFIRNSSPMLNTELLKNITT